MLPFKPLSKASPHDTQSQTPTGRDVRAASGGDGQGSGALSLAGSADMDSMRTRAVSSGEAWDSQQRVTLHPPPRAVIRRVQSENVQLLLRLLRVAAQEVIPVLMQIVDQIPIEAVLRDDVNRACGNRKQLSNRHKNEDMFAPTRDDSQNEELPTIQWKSGNSVQGTCICWHVWR